MLQIKNHVPIHVSVDRSNYDLQCGQLQVFFCLSETATFLFFNAPCINSFT